MDKILDKHFGNFWNWGGVGGTPLAVTQEDCLVRYSFFLNGLQLFAFVSGIGTYKFLQMLIIIHGLQNSKFGQSVQIWASLEFPNGH